MHNNTSAIRLLTVDAPATRTRQRISDEVKAIPRVRLLERFNQARSHALTLVHAPMGYGKTTLLRQFFVARSAHRTCHWLTLTEPDNDINYFARRLELTFEKTPGDDPTHNAFERLEGVLLKAPFCLFLDEFETITNEGVLSFVRELLKRVTSDSEIFIGSRSIPGVGVPRLRAKGAILEFTAHQLSFSHDEVQRLLIERSGQSLNDHQLAMLHRKSGGWAAFIGLFSGTLDGPVSDQELARRIGVGGASMGSLISRQVLDGLSSEVRQFLEDSSVLGEFDAAVCDHALGRQDSREHIEYLERHQLFISRRDPERDLYRYHSLFADLLQSGISADRRRHIQRRAAQWYVLHGRPIPAVNHFLLADCHEAAIRLIEQISPDLLAKGRARLLLRWLDQLSPQSIKSHRALTITLSWALGLSRRHTETQSHLGALAQEDDLPVEQCREIQAIRAVSLAMVDRTHQSLALLKQSPEIVADPHPLRQQVMLHIIIYGLIAENDFTGARNALAQSLALPLEHKGNFTQAMANGFSASIDLIQGRLSTALGQLTSEYDLPSTTQPLFRYRSRSLNDVTLAIALYERNELTRCQSLLTEIMPLITDNGTPDQLIYAHLLMARIHALNQEPALANEYLDELDALSCVHDIPRLSASAWLGRAWMAWKQGDIAGAHYAYRRATVHSGHKDSGLLVVYQHESDWAPLLQLRLAVQGRVAPGTLDQLHSAIEEAKRCGRIRRSLELQLLLVRAHLTLDSNDDRAMALIAAPLRHAIDQGYSRLFLDEGADICRMALRWCETNRALLRNDSGHDSLLESFMAQLGHALACETRQSQEDVILSPREVEVLALLETGLRNTEIANKLFVSETTVRTHLRNISAKLGAHSRTEAVSLARHMKLL
ncbi:LuxR C-terminal-related transcriptional regulator [Pseudomonas sp. NFACC13-1]|uniref:LuxR C-terminal-related transcriptional regulator n=1 Tax=Pseudomonas sp. NFACC13-1 TaxID=1566245 RepID=UPI000889D248|nr:LuxR C-terminal-related transcriptional regulator [Pseudomonas sp. NFACC13-1]SDB35188.1 LuxR family transcriptional regulator, maltose regulon positive regulatory protein [Pseudomonas sp. NFACC13-1]